MSGAVQPHFEIDADLFMRVRRAQELDAARYYLDGVLIEPDDSGGAWLVATDGRAMLVARDKSATAPKAVVVKLSLMESTPIFECDEDACAMSTPSYAGKRLHFDLVENGAALAQIYCHRLKHREAAIAIHTVDGDKFPNWRQVWNRGLARENALGYDGFGVNPDLLHTIAGGEHIQLVDRGAGKAQGILFSGVPEMVGLIMPYNIRTGGKALLDEIHGQRAPSDEGTLA